jgi:peptide-methionine (S)-S-oxide reductase
MIRTSFLARSLAALIAAAALLGVTAPVPGAAAQTERAVFAGGCFWGMEAVFERLRGVTNVVAGYSGGSLPHPSYEQVETGTTGYAESIEVTYDPAVISYRQLLDVYFGVAHDPTQRDRQGPDVGPQYRSAIFYLNDAQRRAALDAIARLTAQHAFSAPIVTQVVAYRSFAPAEAYHQHYFDQHPDSPYIVANDVPKVQALHARFPQLTARL